MSELKVVRAEGAPFARGAAIGAVWWAIAAENLAAGALGGGAYGALNGALIGAVVGVGHHDERVVYQKSPP